MHSLLVDLPEDARSCQTDGEDGIPCGACDVCKGPLAVVCPLCRTCVRDACAVKSIDCLGDALR
eukprot:6604586-Alexandrium_andersonii.AAC.1